MDLIYLLKAAVLGVVEGLTEFLPVSSTGHLILTDDLLNFDSGSGKVFEVVIQLGAILAVCWLYREKILTLIGGVLRRERAALMFAGAVIVAFLPSAVIGFVALKLIKAYLFKPVIVAITLMVGGLIILWVEEREHTVTTEVADRITWRQALAVGVAQVVSMIPGISRSGATIIGGMLGGMSRSAATEFSFFLAIPTMLGATVLDLAKNGAHLDAREIAAIGVGFVVAFVSALIVVKFLIRYVAHHTLSVFAWYRIGFGALLFAWYGIWPLVA
ncbi:undecaprenyl-diphosphate phosphatase [Pinisolibacter aquiterrae]|uniref:undecaprenyl-diphosphate phosphatase n=1 Tax=Pinisolibacter aquiterrae TaxID=2815579 RepID=UPI001C3C2A4A|nr:undecaprenyl-diphosphate phosphatase [Pinisolibacter aquiterrae]MBV5264767.1 undecaprenyl-diphosphate phosphatase [Pinisolibacter aquiterrae]MCC8234186.1 undecaprenyl-diphosphate phosphatase [Pinisolibacter aquiterrae]